MRKTSDAGSRRPARGLVLVAGATAVALTSIALSWPAHGPAAAATEGIPRQDLQRSLDGIVDAGGLGVQAQAVGPRGVRNAVSGTARLDGRVPVPQQGRFRIGSTTKTFIATVVLQLVAEERITLDAPVERYLPGLVPNGENITVRQLLNHTSGLREYLEDTEAYPLKGDDFLTKMRYTTYSAEQLVRGAVRQQPYFPPGADWHYANTNYVLAGLIIEKATGRSYAEEVNRRIVKPLNLWHTSLPGTRTSIPGPHAHGYMRVDGDGGRARSADITRLNPSWAGAAGEMISTTGDINRFFAALLGGRLLPPAQLTAMKTTVPTPAPGFADGLGINRLRLSCGATVWGKDGSIHGFTTQSMHSGDGRRSISLSVTGRDFLGAEHPKVWDAVTKTVETEFCGPGTQAADGAR